MSKDDRKIDEIFNLLDKWRYFPAYQLERRVDIFFAVYLKQIIHSKFNVLVDTIIPEFPVRVGTIYEYSSNKSFKIDYLAVNQEYRKVYLVELKTDIGSRRENQDKYLRLAKEVNINGLMDGLLKIYTATNQKSKYLNLLKEVEKLGWIAFINDNPTYIPNKYEIEIIYIQPEVEHSETTNLDDSTKIITFDDVINIVEKNQDDISTRFAKSLRKWKVNPNIP